MAFWSACFTCVLHTTHSVCFCYAYSYITTVTVTHGVLCCLQVKNELIVFWTYIMTCQTGSTAHVIQYANHFPHYYHSSGYTSSHIFPNLHVSMPQSTVVSLMSDTLTLRVQQMHLQCQYIQSFTTFNSKNNTHIYYLHLMTGLQDILAWLQSGFSQEIVKIWRGRFTKAIVHEAKNTTGKVLL